jgi:transposase
MKRRSSRFSPEVRKRAIRMVRDFGAGPSQLAIDLIAAKVGCSPAALRGWVHRAEQHAAERADLTTYERRRLKELERENRELKRTNDLLRKATAFFAQAAIDRRSNGW